MNRELVLGVKRLLALTTTLLRDWARNREAVFFALLFPLILLLIFSFVFAGGATEFEIAVQNNDLRDASAGTEDGTPTELSETLVMAMEDADPLAVERLDPAVNLTGTDQLEDATDHKRIVVIPEGFDERVRTESGRVRIAVIRDTISRLEGNLSDSEQADIESGIAAVEGQQESTDRKPVPVVLLTTPDDEAAAPVASILDSIIATFNDRALGVDEPTVELTTQERGEDGLDAPDYFLPAFVVAMILINCVMTVPSAVAQFKRDGTLKRLAATPLRRHEWVLANVIQQSILAVLITGVMLVVARFAFSVTVVPGPLSVALLVVGAVAFASLGMIVGSVIRDPGSAISLGGGIALPLMFVSGIFWELDLMPATLQTVAEFSPVTHYHRSLRQLWILDSTDGVGLTFVMLSVLAVVFLTGAVRLTQWQEFD